MRTPAANTSFPLLQSVMKFDRNTGVGEADIATNDAGVTVRVDSNGNLLMTAKSLGITDLLLEAQTGNDAYSWTRTGAWVTPATAASGGISRASPFVTGYETAFSSIPASGSAVYNGTTEGIAYFVTENNGRSGALSGKASFTADFQARTVQGSMTDMQLTVRDAANARDVTTPWNNVAFNADILTTRNGFSGTTSVSNAPGGTGTLPSGATGTIEGRFYGPAAQEAGAVWTLHSGNTAAVGTIKGKQ